MSRRPDQLEQPPLRLRSALREARITKAHLGRLCAHIRHVRLQNPISTTSLFYLFNNGLWPVGYDATELKTTIENAIASAGVSTDGLWEPEAPTSDSRPRNLAAPAPEKGGAPIYENPIPEKEMLSETARRQFGLMAHPFLAEIRGPADVYWSHSARFVREAMFYAAKHGGFMAVIAESGAGKSVLKRDLLERLKKGDDRISVIQPKVPDKKQLTAHHICYAILSDISSEAPKANLEALARQVERALMDSAAAGNTHVLLIEEAHDLTHAALKYLKRFWEIEDGYKKLVGIIIVGQNELAKTLDESRNPNLREVIRRCEIATLGPLGDETRQYVEHKLRRVLGTRSVDTVIEAAALDAIRQRLLLVRQGSKMPEDHTYPLNVQNVVVRALNAAVELGFKTVTAELVREV